MKPRPPTLREKKRYILVSLDPAGLEPDPRLLYLAIQEAAGSLLGDSTAAGIHAAVVAGERGYAIIRCRRGTEDQLATALATITAINGERAALRIKAFSGTIHALKKKIRPCSPDLITPSAGIAMRDIMIDGRAFVPVWRKSNKVNLMEKGFKNRELLFLTQEDIEEL
ncbi:MAG: Rpp14/Pop5 family protein [Methanoregulaceae archaeon]|nr:Rpp14/Pop5 family protein [Methanoregulaceae archaeon]